MELSEDYADDDNPVTLKSEFVLSLCECLIGNLKPVEKTIIDRCVLKTYANYINSNYNVKKLPTLKDLYKVILAQPEDEAKNIALSLEIYINGSLNIFSNTSNINMNNRFTTFDIKDLGKQLKTLGMLIVLDFIWNRVCRNRKTGKRTWIYMDEIYLLFANEYSSNFLYELYKRARKWGGIPTGITQNVEDLLRSFNARSLLSNSEFLLLLKQSASDRNELANLLKISPLQISYVTNTDPGAGLLLSKGHVIPFQDNFPKGTKLYELMTTRVDDV